MRAGGADGRHGESNKQLTLIPVQVLTLVLQVSIQVLGLTWAPGPDPGSGSVIVSDLCSGPGPSDRPVL